MLARQVIARALKPAAQLSSPVLRQPRQTYIATPAFRTYARYKNHPKAPGSATTTPDQPVASSTGAARQTSPGTNLPRDQTWKPKDSIKFGGPAAAAGADAAGRVSSTTSQDSPTDTAEYNTAADPSANTVAEGQPGPTPESVHPGDPTPSTARDQASANEEFQGTQDPAANTEAHTEADAEPRGPLPDLRQGIPSTFASEYGIGRETKSGETTQESEQGFDITAGDAPPPSGRGRRGGDGEEFSQKDYETSTDRRRARTFNYMFASMALFGVTGAAYLSRPFDDAEGIPTGIDPSHLTGWAPGSMYARATSRMSGSVEYYTEPTSRTLLPEVPEAQRAPYTLVLSLEDLMIHSGWTRENGWRTAKRPGIDYFIRYLSQYYELVVFTTVPSAMGDPVVKKLDPFHIIMWPLFREATKYENGKYIKDLAYLNRPLDKVIMIDTKAEHASNQPENAIILPKWNGDPKDPHVRDLVALIPFLEYIATMGIQDTRKVLESFKDKDIPVEFARREAVAREAFNKQLAEDKSRRPKKSIGGLLSNALGVKGGPQGGQMMLDDQTSLAEGLSQGKMLSDLIRERGQREYERLENEIRTNGAKWLKDMEEEEKRFMESSMKDMRKSWFGGFGGNKNE